MPYFEGNSFLQLPGIEQNALSYLDLQIVFKADRPSGTLLFNGNANDADFILIQLQNGYVYFTFDLGNGPATVRYVSSCFGNRPPSSCWSFSTFSRPCIELRVRWKAADGIGCMFRVQPNWPWSLWTITTQTRPCRTVHSHSSACPGRCGWVAFRLTCSPKVACPFWIFHRCRSPNRFKDAFKRWKSMANRSICNRACCQAQMWLPVLTSVKDVPVKMADTVWPSMMATNAIAPSTSRVIVVKRVSFSL